MRLLIGTFTVFSLMAAGALFLLLLSGQIPLLVKPLLCPAGEYQTVTFQTPNPEFPTENITVEQLQCVSATGEATPVNASGFSTVLICALVVAVLMGLIGLFQLATTSGRRGGATYQPAVSPAPPGSLSAAPAQQAALLSDAVRDEALTLLGRNRKIEAIKRVREETGLGLKESKELVEWLEDNHGRA